MSKRTATSASLTTRKAKVPKKPPTHNPGDKSLPPDAEVLQVLDKRPAKLQKQYKPEGSDKFRSSMIYYLLKFKVDDVVQEASFWNIEVPSCAVAGLEIYSGSSVDTLTTQTESAVASVSLTTTTDSTSSTADSLIDNVLKEINDTDNSFGIATPHLSNQLVVDMLSDEDPDDTPIDELRVARGEESVQIQPATSAPEPAIVSAPEHTTPILTSISTPSTISTPAVTKITSQPFVPIIESDASLVITPVENHDHAICQKRFDALEFIVQRQKSQIEYLQEEVSRLVNTFTSFNSSSAKYTDPSNVLIRIARTDSGEYMNDSQWTQRYVSMYSVQQEQADTNGQSCIRKLWAVTNRPNHGTGGRSGVSAPTISKSVSHMCDSMGLDDTFVPTSFDQIPPKLITWFKKYHRPYLLSFLKCSSDLEIEQKANSKILMDILLPLFKKRAHNTGKRVTARGKAAVQASIGTASSSNDA